MKILIHKRRRVFLLFFLGIGLPSFLLGYLAFRGVQNDRALLERERLNEHRKIAELITKLIDRNILEVEKAFISIVVNRQDMLGSEFTHSLEDLMQQHALVEEVFLFQNLEKIHFPVAELLFVPDGYLQPPSATSPPASLAKKIHRGQQLEFQQKQYQRALNNYQQALKQGADPQVKGELLSAVARVQKKSALYHEAIQSYETIAQDFSQVRIADGIPLGLAARLELASLFHAVNDSKRSIEILMKLYRGLIHGEWKLEKSQYDFFAQTVKNSLSEVLSQPSLTEQFRSYKITFQELEAEESERRGLTEKLLMFQEGAKTDLRAKVPQNLDSSIDSSKRYTLEIGEHTYLVSLLIQESNDQEKVDDIWGVLLDGDYLKDSVLLQTLQQNVSSEESGWIVRGRDGRAILKSENAPSGTMTIRANFIGNFPSWLVEFYQEEPRLFETFLKSRRGIYFYMFLLIGGIMIFGLVLTIRTVSRELELARMKSDFVSTISHEFKSPLTSIRQLAEMLQTGRVPSEERRQKYYDVLLEQSERLSLLTENILNFAQIEEGRKEFKFEKIDIGALLQNTVSTIQDRVRHEGFEILLEIEEVLPPIEVDNASITQAVTNLIDNAIKYSGESREIFVRSYKENQNLVIAVQDFGVGIKKEELDKVFDRFYRGGDELTRTVRGSGLGLTLVKKIVGAHRGDVQVESEPGKGSTFSIKLPLP